MKYGILTLLVLGVLSGCSNDKDPSEANFKKAAQANLDAEGPECYFLSYFPIETEQSNQELQNKLQVLEKAGVLTVNAQAKIQIPSLFDKSREKVAPGYELTEEGKKYYKENVAHSFAAGQLGGLCFGKSEIVEITNFSEPENAGGQRIAKVKYTYKISGLPEWAKRPEVYNAFDQDKMNVQNLKAAVESEKKPIKASAAFILTNKGWMHSKQFRK